MPGFCEADRVQHPVLGLGDPHRRVALARQRRDGLRHEGVERAGDVRRGQRVEAAGGVEEPDHAAACRTGPSTQSRRERAVDLDHAAVAGAVAAGHRRLPRELGVRRERAHRLEHRLGPAGEHVTGSGTASPRSRRSARARPRRSGRARPPPHGAACGSRAPPAGRRAAPAMYGNGATPTPPPTSSGRGTSRSEAVAERPEDGQLGARLERARAPASPGRRRRSGTRARRPRAGRGSSAAAAAGPAARA